MAVITITGTTGSGAPEIGASVAQKINMDLVDRFILSAAAKEIGATVDAVARKIDRQFAPKERISVARETRLIPYEVVADQLENIQYELMTTMIRSIAWVVVFPLLVVNGNSHLLRIAVVQTVRATIELPSPIVLRVVNVRIMIESVPTQGALCSP